MEALRQVTRVLDSILVHRPGYTNDTRVYSPDPTDRSPAADFKRDIIRRALAVLDAAQARLSGAHAPVAPVFSGTESDEVEDILADDPERRDFQELVHHASAAQMLLSESTGPVA